MAKVLYQCMFCDSCGWHEDEGYILADYCPDPNIGYQRGSGLRSKRMTKEEAAKKFGENTHPKVKDRAGK
jgi:hypothetical protein